MNQLTTKLFSAGIIATSIAALAGCGGGGGGGNAAASVASPTTVSGTASKGLVKQAKVLVCRIMNGVPDASCVSTTTGNDGSYRVTFMDGFTGSAIVKVMASTTGSPSMMVDETTGADIPYNMTMRAVIPTVSSATTAYVTPFSEMAASAVSTTTINATKITQAIAAVQSAMAGLDIDLSVMPMIDLKDNASDPNLLGMQSNMVKQLSRVALAAKNSSLLTDATGVSCNTKADPSSQIECAITAMASIMTSYVTSDPTKTATMMQALNAQNVTGVTIPVTKPDGTIGMQVANMTDFSSMQTVMQNAGLPTTTAANTANVMMGKMH
jgi:hypothetical protein